MAKKVSAAYVAKRMKRLARQSEPRSFSGVLRHVGMAIRRDIVRAFAEERAPEIIPPGQGEQLAGMKWKPLAESTRRARARKGKSARGRKRGKYTRGLAGKVKALQDTGHMRRAVGQSTSRSRGRARAMAGERTSGPFYSLFHQRGARRGRWVLPARPFIGMAKRTLDEAIRRIMRHVTKQ